MTKTAEKNYNVLLLDTDNKSIRILLEMLAKKTIIGNVTENARKAKLMLEKRAFDLVIFDIACCENWLLFLADIRQADPHLPFIAMSADICPKATANQAIETLHQGCMDFWVKPLDSAYVSDKIDSILPGHKVSSLAFSDQSSSQLLQIVGRSAQMKKTIHLAKKTAPTSAPVMITGESGTGKELLSQLIHVCSPRKQAPYIRVNCAALNESLLESELFGHEKGAFTGAHNRRKGRFELAHGGTLLLDEITETPLHFQSKLLRILEQNTFERVGGNEIVKADVRIISTTNKNIVEEVALGRFRKDLYYRLSAIRLVIGPLRDRTEDIEDLIWYFINQYSHETQRNIKQLDPDLLEVFNKYSWPGNIRQLRNAIRTSLIFGQGTVLRLPDVDWLFEEFETEPAGQKTSGLAGMPLEKVEKRAIMETLELNEGNQVKAAKALGITDRTLRVKIKRYKQQGTLQELTT